MTLGEELRRKYALTSLRAKGEPLSLLANNETLDAAAEIAEQEHAPIIAATRPELEVGRRQNGSRFSPRASGSLQVSVNSRRAHDENRRPHALAACLRWRMLALSAQSAELLKSESLQYVRRNAFALPQR
jgi:hypothetical protein